jgi:hypothetical protein
MMIVSLRINNRGPYNFVMDTGVGLMVITDPTLIDSIGVITKRTIKVVGLGGDGEELDAWVTSNLDVRLDNVSGDNLSAAIFKKDHFGLSNYAGIKIHGLLGYEFFNSFAVRVNFMDSTLTVGALKDIRISRKSCRVPISIEEHKPYLNSDVTLANGTVIHSKLIVDFGAGHSLSLEKLLGLNYNPERCITANLGMGLSGPISGYISRITQMQLANYKVSNIIASFPDFNELSSKLSVDRDGNLGIDVLKRFNIVIDYQSNALYIKPNYNFKQPFEHDMSGLEYYADGNDLKRIIINRVETGSAGDDIGLRKGDEIVSINFKPVAKMSIEEIDGIFRSRNDRTLLLEINHDKQLDRVILTLKRRI